MSQANTIRVNLSDMIDRATEARNKARDEGDQVLAKIQAEKAKDDTRQMTVDEKTELTDAQSRMVAAQEELNLYSTQSDAVRDDPIGEKLNGRLKLAGGEADGEGESRKESKQDQEYRSAFDQYMRRGIQGMKQEDREILQSRLDDSEEVRALTTTVGASGAFTIPEGFVPQINEARKQFSWMAQAGVSSLNTSTGNPLPFPTSDGTSEEGELLGENTAVAEADPVFGQTIMGAYLYSSKAIIVPNTLLVDEAVNLENFLAQRIGMRLGRITSKHATTGTGVGQPQGIVVGASVGFTAAAAAAITHDEIIELEHSVDPAYRIGPSVGHMFHDTTLKLFRKLKDSEGRPLWQPSLIAGLAPSLNGYRYTINQNMDTPAATKDTMLFGDMSLYQWRTAGSMVMLRLSERYAEKFQTAFLAFERHDGKIVDASGGAFKKLRQSV